jgi:5-formyltetrahydrofolate cyclo-ligase
LSAIELISPWKVRGRPPCGDRGTVTGGFEQVQIQSVPADAAATSEKRRLRKDLRAVRQSLDASALARAARAAATAAEALPELGAARTVAGYAACDGELDVAEILAAARMRGATIVLPRCRAGGGGLDLVPTVLDDALVHGRRGRVLEPPGPACDPTALPRPAVILVPSVALDRRGFRLGRGGGDYDRLLPQLRRAGWTIVGVAHATALVNEVPTEPHDAPVDMILTDAGVVIPGR